MEPKNVGGAAETTSANTGWDAKKKILDRRAAYAQTHSSTRYAYARDVVAPALAQAFGANRVWLFGSVARNDASCDSDIDLLVESGDEYMQPKRRLFLASEIVQSLNAPFSIDVAVLTEGEFEQKIKTGSRFAYAILSDRRILHERKF